MSERVKVKFNKSYMAARGAGIAGVEGAEKEFRMTDQLRALLDDGTVSLVRETPATKRKKATKKDAKE